MRTPVLLLSLLVACLAGCGAPSPKEIAAKTGNEVSSFLREALDTGEASNGFTSLAQLDRAMTQVAGRTPRGRGDVLPLFPLASSTDDGFSQMRKFIEDRVFTDANVESSGGGQAVFRLFGDDLCSDGKSTPSDACVKQIDSLELRVRAATASGDGLDLTVLVGSQRAEVLTVRIRPQVSLAVEVDAANAKVFLDLLNATSSSSSAKFLSELQSAQGSAALTLTRNGPKDFTLALAVVRSLSFSIKDNQGLTYSASTGTADPLASLRIDAPGHKVTSLVAVGATVLTGPVRTFFPRATSSGDLQAALAGLTATLTAEDGQSTFTVTNLGIGATTSTLSVGGSAVASFDLNASASRRLEATVSVGSDGALSQIALSPSLAFSAALQLASLGDVPSWAAGETYAVNFSGSPAFKPVSGGLKVLGGVLSVASTRSGTTPVSVTASQCLAFDGSTSPPAHPLLGALRVATCP